MSWSPFFLSLRVACAATLLSLALGLPVGYWLARRRGAVRGVAEGVAMLPLVLPPTVLGYYLLVLFGRTSPLGLLIHRSLGIDITFTWQGAALAACAVSAPLLVRAAQSAFSAVDVELLASARTMGATEGQAFWHVTLPLARRGLLTGTGVAFARALGDFGATLMVAGDIPGATRTMPLAIYDAVYSDATRTAVIYVLLLSAVCLVFSVLGSLFEQHP